MKDPSPGRTCRQARTPTRLSLATVAAVVLVVLDRLPFVTRATSPDEGGLLLVAAQWHSGGSLYGDYWVDRPPLLIGIVQLADALGGTAALRLIGIVAAVASVLLAASLTRVATGAAKDPRALSALVAPVMIAALMVASPLFGDGKVDGELLTTPVVLAGVLALLRAVTARRRTAISTGAFAAGVAAACAPMIKQNAVDVFVAAGLIILTLCLGRSWRRAGRVALWFAVGASAAAAVILGLAAMRGTDPGGLWDAVVTFRFQAAGVIQGAAPDTNSARRTALVLAVAGSAVPLVALVLAWQCRRPASLEPDHLRVLDLRWIALALLVWEIAAIAGGGSFWRHYLLNLIPGLVLLAVAAAQRPPSARRGLAVALTVAVLSTGIATSVDAMWVPDETDAVAVSYLRTHAAPGDTAMVAFGHPNILWEAGLSSPYEHLWSLPVRVRDPRLDRLSAVLSSAQAPRWVVVAGSSLASWGIDASRADAVLAQRYRRVATVGTYAVWRLVPAGS